MILRRLYIYIYITSSVHYTHLTQQKHLKSSLLLSFWLYSRKRFPVKDSLLPYLQAAGARGGAGRRRACRSERVRRRRLRPLRQKFGRGRRQGRVTAEILFVSPRAGTIGTSFVPETFRRKTDSAFRSHLYVTRRTAKRKT